MKSELDTPTSELKDQLSKFLANFHVTIYTVFIVGGLSTVVFFVYQSVIQSIYSTRDDYTAIAPFDLQTIEKLESLSQKSGAKDDIDFPSGQRINPFVE